MISINSKKIVLASTAGWRSDLLNQVGIRHRTAPHKYNEPKYREGSLDQFIENIARQKARSLEDEFPDSIIVAADQLACIEHTILYKPGSREGAVEQLEILNGKTHLLVCAVAVLFEGDLISKIETAELKMRNLQRVEIETYVDRDEPWDCAGAYKYESLGASLFEKVKVNDPSTIIGLPIHSLLSILRGLGFSNLIR